MDFRLARQRAVAAAQLDDRLHRESRRHEPLPRRRNVVMRQRDQVQAGIARERVAELLRQRRVMRGGEDLDEAALQPREAVRRAGRLERAGRIRIGLHVGQRHAETEPLQLRARRIKIGDEITDVIEEDFPACRQLPVEPAAHALNTVGQSASSSGTIQLS